MLKLLTFGKEELVKYNDYIAEIVGVQDNGQYYVVRNNEYPRGDWLEEVVSAEELFKIDDDFDINCSVEVDSQELNQLWLTYLEEYKLAFLMQDIDSEYIDALKDFEFIYLFKYTDDLGTGIDWLFWTVSLKFKYKDEIFILKAQETDRDWLISDWENAESEDEDVEHIRDVLSICHTNDVIDQFMKEILNSKYRLAVNL